MKQVLTFKYHFMLLIAGFTMLMSSCQKEELLNSPQKQDLLTSSQTQDLQKKAVPFKGKFTLIGESISPIHLQFNGTGEGSHIGKFTLVDQVYLDRSIPNTAIITAANGDQILTTFSATAVEAGPNGTRLVTNYNIITGGTGRFAGATGNFISHAILSTNTTTGITTGSDSFDGTISY
ncbi:MAG: hypothetical protein ABIN89_12250 [Chitinophagaceae bacterium]